MVSWSYFQVRFFCGKRVYLLVNPVADAGGQGGHAPPWPVKIGQKKMAAERGRLYFMFMAHALWSFWIRYWNPLQEQKKRTSNSFKAKFWPLFTKNAKFLTFDSNKSFNVWFKSKRQYIYMYMVHFKITLHVQVIVYCKKWSYPQDYGPGIYPEFKQYILYSKKKKK